MKNKKVSGSSFQNRIRGALDVFRGRSVPFTSQKLMVAAHAAMKAARHFERDRISNTYDAGKTGRQRSDWGTTTDVPYYELLTSHNKIRARSRDLYKNDSTYRAAINAIVNIVVGRGLRPKPRIVSYENKPNEILNKEIELYSRRYFETKEWDAGRRINFIGEGQRLALKTQLISGDVILNAVSNKNGYLPIAWQMVEIDRLDTSLDTFVRTFSDSENIKQTVHGININEYGAPVSYNFKGVPKPVSANNIIHSYLQERPEQYIGEPLGTAILDSVYDKHDIDEDYLLKSRAIAKFLWWMSSLNDKFPNAGDQDSDGVIEMDSLTQMRSEEAPEMFKMPDSINDTIEPLLRMKKHDICSGLGLSYITVLLDMGGVNFAAASMNAIKENTNMSVLRSKFIDSFCQPMWDKFIRTLVVENKLTGVSPARFELDPNHYCRCEWTTDPREYADPQKTVGARISSLNAGRITLTEDLAERGKDIREHIAELKQERELLKEAGIEIPEMMPEPEPVEPEPEQVEEQNA